MVRLSAEERKFLHDELNISSDEISLISKEKWLEIKEKCFDIEVEESMKAAENNDNDCVMPMREVIAVRLAERTLSELGIE